MSLLQCPRCGKARRVEDSCCPGCGVPFDEHGMKVSSVARRIPAELDARRFQHPEDRAALNRLRTLSPVLALTRMAMRHLTEPVLKAQLLGRGIRVGPEQFPDLHRIVTESAAVLRMEPPDCFVINDPRFNAATYGVERPFVILHSSLVDAFTADELYFVIGHELGHVRSEHVLYLNAAEFLARGAAAYLGHLVLVAARGALDAWMRKAELTADRAGLLCAQDLDVACRALLKLAVGSVNLLGRLDPDAYLKETEELEHGYGRAVEFLENHPFVSNRIRELRRFVEQGTYERLLGGGRAAVGRRQGAPPATGEEAERLAAQALERGLALLREPAGLFPVDRGPRQRALDEFSWVLTAYPETRAAADALFHSGTVHLLGRDYREAVRLFRRFVERYPEHALAAEATYLVGYTCERHLGDRAAALAAYEQVIRRYPGSPRAMDAREALAR